MSRAAPTIVKIGGSLLGEPARLRALLAELAAGAHGPCLIVPGGGPFAEAVRVAQAGAGFGDGLAHRLALDAMACTAAILAEIEPCLLDAGPVTIWDAAEIRAGHPEIAETWAVTSDSLALWLARRVGAPRCVLVKAADAPPSADPAALARLGIVDTAFPAYAARYGGPIAIWGPGGSVPVAAARAAA